MKINAEIIKALTPCKDRFDNFTSNNPDFSGGLRSFIALANIIYDDKVWVITRLFTRVHNVKWAVACAYSTLHLFEEKYVEDKRPRLALEATSRWVKDPSDENLKLVRDANAAAANNAAYRAAANAYYAANAADAERERQVDALAFLLSA